MTQHRRFRFLAKGHADILLDLMVAGDLRGNLVTY
jgi:hypothetical protein